MEAQTFSRTSDCVQRVIDVRPLSPALGAEIVGVDLRDADRRCAASSRCLDAWHQHLVILLRDQTLDRGRSGPLRRALRPAGQDPHSAVPSGKHPAVMLISNIREDGKPIGALPDGEMHFHTDQCHQEMPAKATMLYAIEIPSQGGNTLFANAYTAYETLPDDIKRRLDGRKALNAYDYDTTPPSAKHDDARGCAVALASGGAHPSGDRPQGALRQPPDDAARSKACRREESEALLQIAVRSPGAAAVRLRARLARRRHPDVGQSLHAACAHGFLRRRAAPVAARDDPGREAGVNDFASSARRGNDYKGGDDDKKQHALAAAGLALLAGTSMAGAADVTFERLSNPEPRNWLMNHGNYGAHHYSALDRINKSNVKNLRMAFSVALGQKGGNENLLATPLVDDGFMYMTDAWGIVYKIDVRSGTSGPIVWKMDPAQAKMDRNRGVALWGNLVISVTSHDGRVVATDKETGKVVWDKNLRDQPDMTLNAAPLALKDSILVGASGGDQGVRNWLVALDAKTGDEKWRFHTIPGPGEPGHDSWKDKNNAWQTGGGAFYVTGSYDPATNTTYWGSGNPSPKYDSSYRPGDNLYTNSALAHRCRDRQAALVSPVHAQRHDGLRRERQSHPDRHQGRRRGSQDAGARRPQRLRLQLRPQQRPVPQGHAIREQGDLDQGHRSEDRQAGRL